MASRKPENSKTGSSKRRTKKSSLPLDKEEIVMPKAEQINIENLFTQALMRFKDDELADKKQKHKEINHLANIVEEYLSCFMLIGFSMQGEKVCVFTAPTSKDEGAIMDLLRSTFFDISNNRP